MKGWVLLMALSLLTVVAACSKSNKAISPDRVKFGEDGKYYLDGKPWSGKQSSQFANGKTQFEGELVDGLQHGEWKWYYESGNVQSSITYKVGKLDGNETHRFDNAANSLALVKTFQGGQYVTTYQWRQDGTLITAPKQPAPTAPLAVP